MAPTEKVAVPGAVTRVLAGWMAMAGTSSTVRIAWVLTAGEPIPSLTVTV